MLAFTVLSLAQNGPQIAVSPGIITTVAGHNNAALAAATFNGVAFKAPSTVYVSDSHVARYTSTGTAVYIANVYGIDLNSGQVTRIAGAAPDAVNGNATTVLSGDGGLAINARLNQPAGLALDSAGNLYVADSGQNAVRKIDATTNIITTVAGNGNPDLNVAFSGDGGPATSAQLAFPTAIAFNASDDLFISDTFHRRVRVVSASSRIINTVAGNGTEAHSGDGGPAVNASLDTPLGIAVDKNNNVYIADSSTASTAANELVRKVDGAGTITTVLDQLSRPYGVAVDAAGTLYIADTGHNKILRVATDGQVAPVAGNGSAGFSGDGGPALAAALSGPASLTTSSAGDLYFVDSGQPAVRRVTGSPAPVVFPLTAAGSSSGPITVTVSATGNQDLVVSQTNPPTNFTITGGTCGAAPFTLISGRSCTLELTFRPQAGGPTAGTLNIVSNAVNSAITPVLLSMSNGLYFVPVQPCRLIDTRWPNGTYGGPFLAANQTRNFAIRFSSNSDRANYPGACSSAPVPSGADVQAYSLNVTVVPKRTLRWLTVSPSNSSVDTNNVSTLNSYDGRTKANAAIVPADTSDNNRAISIFAKDDTDVIVDINGYYVPEATASALAFYALSPCRAVDTREGNTGPMGAGETRTFSMQGTCGLPPSALAYALNFTAVPKSSRLAYLTVWPAGSDQPFVSTLNSTTGAVTANAAVVPVGSGGAISAYTTDAADVIVDVSGYYAPRGPGGLALYNVTPCRSFDSRGNSGTGAPVSGVYNVNVAGGCSSVSSNAQSIVLNATVVPAASLSYLTLWARGQSQPLQSTLNAYDSAVTSNLAVVPTTDGWVSSYTTAPTALILDVFGYFAP
ncbi:MAG: choice-of-anchor D domain-containing protein [Bryobacteraceae bacterium]